MYKTTVGNNLIMNTENILIMTIPIRTVPLLGKVRST